MKPTARLAAVAATVIALVVLAMNTVPASAASGVEFSSTINGVDVAHANANRPLKMYTQSNGPRAWRNASTPT